MKEPIQKIPLDINIGLAEKTDGSPADSVALAFHQGSMYFTLVIPMQDVGAFQEAMLDGIQKALLSATLHLVKD